MHQIVQNLRTGRTSLEQFPTPQVQSGQVKVQTSCSLVSLGTERMLVDFGKASLVQKARQQPEKVKQVLDKVRAEGLLPTMEAVFRKLEQPLPLGYCNVGKVVEVGTGVSGFSLGDRVASNGAHASVVCVPQNLVAKIPDNVSDEEAAFTVVGAIGLQGIRLLNVTFGETAVVIGLGLVGLLSAELLKAHGCKVIGIDLDPEKLDIAEAKGIMAINSREVDPVEAVMQATGHHGADAVLIAASTKENSVISQAANMSRKRGRIVLVGVVGLQLNRADFYEKELTFQVSCSYGPGRYDPAYEQRGQDYPLPYVRWTEQRNFVAVLQAMANGQLDVKPLITRRVPFEEYDTIYNSLNGQEGVGNLLIYPEAEELSSSIEVTSRSFAGQRGVFGIVGAGNFTKMTLLPVLANAKLKYIAGAGGLNAKTLAEKYGINICTSDYREIIADAEVDNVIITTRHHLHAVVVIEALQAGKNVFVEKPLCLNIAELDQIMESYQQSNASLNVGFNRRFSPHIEKIKSLLPAGISKNMIATMNAGFIPVEHWVHDPEVGGGRIAGEACHYLDLLVYLSGSKIISICMSALGDDPSPANDNAMMLMRFANGDQGAIHYLSNGHRGYSKERLEIHSAGKTIVMDNYRKTRAFGFKGFSGLKTKIDKGHKNQFKALIDRAENGGDALIPFDEIVNVARATFAVLESLRSRRWVDVV